MQKINELEVVARLSGMTYADGLYYTITNNDAVIFLIDFMDKEKNSILYKFEQLIGGHIKIVGKARDGFNFSNWKCRTLDLSEFDTSEMTTMSNMFCGCITTELDLSNFDTSNVTDMSYMFCNCITIELDLSNFDTSNVTNMSYMFHDCSASAIDLSNFDTSNITNMSYMFHGCSASKIDFSSFNTSKVENMRNMFCRADVDKLDLSTFDTSNVTDMENMFADCNTPEIDFSSFNTQKVKTMNSMFARTCLSIIDISHFDTSNVTNMANMFAAFASSAQRHIIFGEKFITTKVLTMKYMFSGCNLYKLDFTKFDVRNVRNMESMFRWCTIEELSLDLNSINVRNMESMFCATKINSLKLFKINMSKVEKAAEMFKRCTIDKALDLRCTTFKEQIDVGKMFENCEISCIYMNKKDYDCIKDKIKNDVCTTQIIVEEERL